MARVMIHPRKKQKVYERDNFTCQNCGEIGDFKCLEIDHIIPVCEGGNNDLHNLQTLCYECNMKKRHSKLFDNEIRKEFEELNKKPPLEKLEFIKLEAEKYSHLSKRDLRLIFNQIPLFRFLNISLNTIEDYLFPKGKKDSLGKTETMYKKMLAKVMVVLKNNYEIKQKEIAEQIGEDYKKISHIVVWAKDGGHLKEDFKK